MMIAQEPLAKKPEPHLNTSKKEPTQPVKKPAEQRGAFAVPTLEDDVDRKLLEPVQGGTHEERLKAKGERRK
jgi:hypothetical protein